MSTHKKSLPYWFASPAALIVLALVALPLVITLSLSLYPFQASGDIGHHMTTENYHQVITDGYYQSVFCVPSPWLAW